MQMPAGNPLERNVCGLGSKQTCVIYINVPGRLYMLYIRVLCNGEVNALCASAELEVGVIIVTDACLSYS